MYPVRNVTTTAFTDKERRALDFVGLLPPRTLDLDQQATRAYALYRVQRSHVAKNVLTLPLIIDITS
jgi:hypothetical protein